MGETIIGSVVQPATESLLGAIREQLKYVVCYRTYIKDLDRVSMDLSNSRETIMHQVVAAVRNAENIENEVTNWLEQVNNRIQEAKEVLEKHKISKKGCFRGVVPNPSTRYSIAKQAEDKRKAIDELLRKRSEFGGTISYRNPPPGIVTGTYAAGGSQWMISKSRASVLEDISKALLDPTIRMVGIWGASGVGKSTLLKEVEKQVHEKRFNYDFDEVAFAVVSRSPNPEAIQDDLAYSLGLKLDEEKSVVQKANRLRERLSQKRKVLIILDDIGEKLDLQSLGIPSDDNHPGIKLVLTSKTEELLMSEMNSKRNFYLDRLEDSEAIDLFKQIVGDRPSEDVKLIDQLAKECAGSPVLISSLAAALRSCPSSKWDEALSNVRQSNELRTEEFIQNSLEFNYRLIESEDVKSLFLLCSRIGKQIILVDDLLIYGMGLGLQKGVHTREEAREKFKPLLKYLVDSCLLENYREGFVKIHDRIGDAALSIASKTHPSLVIRNGEMLKAYSDDDLRGCGYITLYLDDRRHELPERLTCPILDMLLIYGNATQRTHLEIPDAFFNDLRELKVLDLSDLTISLLPSSIQFLDKLHTLCLDRVAIKDIAIVGKLKTLQSLTIRGSIIYRIPKEIGELCDLRLLDLESCHNLEIIEPGVLRRLILLEELMLPLTFVKWDAKGIRNASLTELDNMPYLSTLTICVSDVASFPNNMAFHGLVKFHIEIGDCWAWSFKGEARILQIELDSCSSELVYKEWLQLFLKKTHSLALHGWIGREKAFTMLSKEGFPQLKHICVENCPSIQYMIHSKQPDPFPALESLSLSCLINLRKICKDDLPKHLGKLKAIEIESCDELRSLFSSSLVKDLPLEEIEVSDCIMMQEIITYTETDGIVEGGENTGDNFELLKLKHLRKLKLTNLRKVSSFCSKVTTDNVEGDGNNSSEFLDGRQISLPCLEFLILCEMPKLRKISHSQHSVDLHKLKSLELLKCNSLLYALDSNLLQQLESLESLAVEDCESMETVFYMEELNPACEATSNRFAQINLKLNNLPRLKKIWDRNSQVVSSVLRRVKKLEVSKCDELGNLFSRSVATSLGNISHISIDSCRTMEEILLEENDEPEIEFSLLSYLSISNMENLIAFSHGGHHYRFPSLMQLEVSRCPKMRTFVPCDDATEHESFFNQKVILPRLEKLVLHSLESLISIWGNNLYEDSFCNLASIKIAKCARVSSIFHSHLKERLQNLTQISLLDLPKLEHVVMESHIVKEAMTFQNLRDIFVEDCHYLKHLFPNVTARSLSELVNMNISSCKSLEKVISFDGEDGDMALTDSLGFYNLSSLRLENLESLVHFCLGNCDLHFPYLKELSIIECKTLKTFILRSPNLVGLKEKLQEVSPTGNIEDSFPLFDEKVMFPNLEELQIKGLEVKEIWPKKEPASWLMELKRLEVEDCHQLSTIVPSCMLQNLHSLKHLVVKSCNSVEVIIELEKNNSRRQSILEHLQDLTVSSCESIQHIVARKDHGFIGKTYYKTILFAQLSSLILSKLPKLGSFCHKNHEIELSSIEKLEIKDCQSVEVLIADSNQDCEPLLLVKKIQFLRMVIINMENLTKLWHISEEGTDSECLSEAFSKLKQLKVEECGSLLTIFPAKMIRAIRNLEELIVLHCESLECVFESTELSSGAESSNVVSSTTFALRLLELKHLPQMKYVWNVEDPRWVHLSFEKLHSIRINECHSLIHLFPASLARYLDQLYRLIIEDCNGMEEIVWNEDSAHQESLSMPPESSNITLGMHSLIWPSLERLTIIKCRNAKILASMLRKKEDFTDIDGLIKVNIPRLERMFTDASTLENRQFLDEIYANPTFLSLKNIENQAWVKSIPWSLLLERFPNIQAIGIRKSDSKEIFPSEKENVGAAGILDIAKGLAIRECHHLTILPPFLALFHNLTRLRVVQCHGLQYLVTSSVSRSLVQLTHLKIGECNNLEEIVTYDCDENGNKAKHDNDMISFPHLTTLWLWDLPVLRSFSSTSCKFSFPSLKNVNMEKLPKMDVFCEGELISPYKHRITRNVRALYNKEIGMWWIRPGS